MRLLIATAILLLHGAAWADAPIRFPRGTPYAQARLILQRLGYREFFMPGADFCDPDDPRCYPELESCAKTRSWSCAYTWERGRTIVRVGTIYGRPTVSSTECLVNCGD